MARTSSERRAVVVTGGTKGIGRAMVEALLARGADVGLCGRDTRAVDEAKDALVSRYGEGRVVAQICDVTREEDLEGLFSATKEAFGRVDVWVNNAGTSSPQVSFLEQDASTVRSVVETNLLGTMLGSRVALRGMKAQGFGALYNMEGFGSDGARQLGMSTYGATKCGVRYFTRSLAEELRSTPLLVCTLSPGVVVTDLLVDVYRKGDPKVHARAQRLFQFIADTPDVVGDFLAKAVLENRRTDVRLAWMTVPKAILRFFQPKYHTRKIFPGPGDPR
ncbi:MAG: SDR family oxidoreductase [Myxococcales bacterium]|nr:SDR family oxidoreductase [Myxococcales bacterium]